MLRLEDLHDRQTVWLWHPVDVDRDERPVKPRPMASVLTLGSIGGEWWTFHPRADYFPGYDRDPNATVSHTPRVEVYATEEEAVEGWREATRLWAQRRILEAAAAMDGAGLALLPLSSVLAPVEAERDRFKAERDEALARVAELDYRRQMVAELALVVERERDTLRARVAELEAAAKWTPVSVRLPSMAEVTSLRTSRVLYCPAGSSRCREANYLYGKGEIGTKHGPRWMLATGGEEWVRMGDHWRWMPAGPEADHG